MNSQEKAALIIFLMVISVSYSGAGLVYRNQSLRRETESAAWGLWRIPCSPAGNLAKNEAGSILSQEDVLASALPEPAASERLKDDLGINGLELTGLKRIARTEGIDFIIQARGSIGGILRYLENLPRRLPGWCFRDLSLKRRDDSYTLELVVGESKTAAAIGRTFFTNPETSDSSDLERRLFSRYPRREITPPGNPARLGVSSIYSSPPDWLVLSGVEKSGNQGLTYLFLDSRTGRVRRLPQGGQAGDWALIPGNPGWILRIGGESYFLGGL